ncbi:MAG: hypothetical protein ABI612_08235 [Betaproteobacteria bacterium]
MVQEWKDERVYPYEGKATTRIEEAERQVFDIVAVTAAQYLPDFHNRAAEEQGSSSASPAASN